MREDIKNHIGLLEDMLPDMEARVEGLRKIFPAPDILTALHRNETFVRRIKEVTGKKKGMLSRDEVMKSREMLMMETIELENSLMIYKKGLHLAKRFIDSHVGDPDMSSEMIEAYSAYKAFLKDNGLEGI